MAELTIVEVADPLAGWAELEPLYRGLHEHHEPLRQFKLVDGWQAAQQEALTAEGEVLVLVARAGERAIGVLDGRIRVHPITGVRTGYINSAFVDPASRERGVTRGLVGRFTSWAREHGATELGLNVDVLNAEGVAAWRALGFEERSYQMGIALE
jgi:GNAT superfamily N-acetyltransferase